MNHFHENEIEKMIERGCDENHNPNIMGVIYSLGRDAENEEEYQYAVQKLLQIFDAGTDSVRAYCIQALSLLAVYGFPLDKNRIAPLILRERKNATGKNLSIINDAMEDLALSQQWSFGGEI